jgi:hypothetical protein
LFSNFSGAAVEKLEARNHMAMSPVVASQGLFRDPLSVNESGKGEKYVSVLGFASCI